MSTSGSYKTENNHCLYLTFSLLGYGLCPSSYLLLYSCRLLFFFFLLLLFLFLFLDSTPLFVLLLHSTSTKTHSILWPFLVCQPTTSLSSFNLSSLLHSTHPPFSSSHSTITFCNNNSFSTCQCSVSSRPYPSSLQHTHTSSYLSSQPALFFTLGHFLTQLLLPFFLPSPLLGQLFFYTPHPSLPFLYPATFFFSLKISTQPGL